MATTAGVHGFAQTDPEAHSLPARAPAPVHPDERRAVALERAFQQGFTHGHNVHDAAKTVVLVLAWLLGMVAGSAFTIVAIRCL